jgi:hypothetical protein
MLVSFPVLWSPSLFVCLSKSISFHLPSSSAFFSDSCFPIDVISARVFIRMHVFSGATKDCAKLNVIEVWSFKHKCTIICMRRQCVHIHRQRKLKGLKGSIGRGIEQKEYDSSLLLIRWWSWRVGFAVNQILCLAPPLPGRLWHLQHLNSTADLNLSRQLLQTRALITAVNVKNMSRVTKSKAWELRRTCARATSANTLQDDKRVTDGGISQQNHNKGTFESITRSYWIGFGTMRQMCSQLKTYIFCHREAKRNKKKNNVETAIHWHIDERAWKHLVQKPLEADLATGEQVKSCETMEDMNAKIKLPTEESNRWTYASPQDVFQYATEQPS